VNINAPAFSISDHGQIVSPSLIMNGMELYVQFKMLCTNKRHIYPNPIDNWDKVKKNIT